MSVKFNSAYAASFLRENDLIGLKGQITEAHNAVEAKSGLGNDFLGWVDLTVNYDK